MRTIRITDVGVLLVAAFPQREAPTSLKRSGAERIAALFRATASDASDPLPKPRSIALTITFFISDFYSCVLQCDPPLPAPITLSEERRIGPLRSSAGRGPDDSDKPTRPSFRGAQRCPRTVC